MVELAVNPHLPNMSNAMDNSGTAGKDRGIVTVIALKQEGYSNCLTEFWCYTSFESVTSRVSGQAQGYYTVLNSDFLELYFQDYCLEK